MADALDVAVDRALGISVEPVAVNTQESLAPNRAIFDELVRQQREIMALQREAYNDLLAKARVEQDNFVVLLEKLGLIDLRLSIDAEWHTKDYLI